jgi:hypothetical protein
MSTLCKVSKIFEFEKINNDSKKQVENVVKNVKLFKLVEFQVFLSDNLENKRPEHVENHRKTPIVKE